MFLLGLHRLRMLQHGIDYQSVDALSLHRMAVAFALLVMAEKMHSPSQVTAACSSMVSMVIMVVLDLKASAARGRLFKAKEDVKSRHYKNNIEKHTCLDFSFVVSLG